MRQESHPCAFYGKTTQLPSTGTNPKHWLETSSGSVVGAVSLGMAEDDGYGTVAAGGTRR